MTLTENLNRVFGYNVIGISPMMMRRIKKEFGYTVETGIETCGTSKIRTYEITRYNQIIHSFVVEVDYTKGFDKAHKIIKESNNFAWNYILEKLPNLNKVERVIESEEDKLKKIKQVLNSKSNNKLDMIQSIVMRKYSL